VPARAAAGFVMPSAPLNLRPDVATVAVAFGDLLHRAGLAVTPERSGRFAQAIALVDPAARADLYWLARVTLVARHEDLETFDRLFDLVFGGASDVAFRAGDAAGPSVRARPVPAAPRTVAGRPPASREQPGSGHSRLPVRAGPGDEPDRRHEPAVIIGIMSPEERLATTDFVDLDDEELVALLALMRQLRVSPPLRRGRRYRRQPGHGGRLDLRATLRRGRRSGGDPVTRLRRRQPPRRRRLVVLCDISGSMEPYARAYLQFLHATVGGSRAEVFTFATRLTRLTRALAVTDPGLALARATTTAPDWKGGTLIGQALKSFLDGYGRRGVARGAVVVVVSDGWEGADPALVGEQMARLHRMAHRIIWVNPRTADPRYRPLAGGMAAALPYCDSVLSGHTFEALKDVAASIARP
jgi:uncharacterized protein with von Willebrand factor type A (vWA) domain